MKHKNNPSFVPATGDAILGDAQSIRPLDVWSQKKAQMFHLVMWSCGHLGLRCRAQQSSMPDSMSRGNSLTTNDMGDMLHPSSPSSLRMNLHVGVLHYDPSFEPFPLLTDPVHYEPNTVDISDDKHMLDYWLNILTDSVPTIMAKAIASEGGKAGTNCAQLACCCICYAFNRYGRQCKRTCANSRQHHIMRSKLYAIGASAAVRQLAVKQSSCKLSSCHEIQRSKFGAADMTLTKAANLVQQQYLA
jgi:hypothetical protein